MYVNKRKTCEENESQPSPRERHNYDSENSYPAIPSQPTRKRFKNPLCERFGQGHHIPPQSPGIGRSRFFNFNCIHVEGIHPTRTLNPQTFTITSSTS